jgi:hypothetical protein
MSDDLTDLLQQPDAVLLRQGKGLDQQLAFYTVPLFIFDGEPSEESYQASGSGVLVRLWGYTFIFTAGHCIVDEPRVYGIGIIRGTPHQFTPKVHRSRRYVANSAVDFGYLQLNSEDAATIEARDRVFASPNRLHVASADELKAEDDWMLVSGFPGTLATPVPNGRLVQQLHFATTIAGSGIAPSSPLGDPPTGMEVIDLWVPMEGLINTTSGGFEEVSMPMLSGVSGGGCWKGGVRPDGADWSPTRLKLAGVHIGSSNEVDIEGKKHRFTREVSIKHHLRLVYEDVPALREHIASEWPDIPAMPLV